MHDDCVCVFFFSLMMIVCLMGIVFVVSFMLLCHLFGMIVCLLGLVVIKNALF
jgi:hypothetical protein